MTHVHVACARINSCIHVCVCCVIASVYSCTALSCVLFLPYIYACIYTYVYISIYTYVYMSIFLLTCICIYVHDRVCLYTHTHPQTHTHTHTHTHMHTHAHTHTQVSQEYSGRATQSPLTVSTRAARVTIPVIAPGSSLPQMAQKMSFSFSDTSGSMLELVFLFF